MSTKSIDLFIWTAKLVALSLIFGTIAYGIYLGELGHRQAIKELMEESDSCEERIKRCEHYEKVCSTPPFK